MSPEEETHTPVEAPADIPEIQRGTWLPLAPGDPVAEYVASDLWDGPGRPASWEVARLSGAAYVYREASTRWSVVTKFYGVKTGSSAQKYAERERESIRQVEAVGLAEGRARPVRLLGLWRGALFLEHVLGLTLEDMIAVRHSQPGRLTDALEWVARFLAEFHVLTAREHERPDFEPSLRYAHGVVEQLAKYGILERSPITREGVTRLIDRWAARPEMSSFAPSLNHGDATTTNFVIPSEEGVVVIDWERLSRGDPASDLGRLFAEVTHSINQHGGSEMEAEPYVHHVGNAYGRVLPGRWDADGLLKRARFYRASSTLRIARNGWVSRLDRTALVAQAMALLSD